MDASQLLINSLSPDAATRQSATQQLETAARDNYPGYVVTLSHELANENALAHVRNAAAVALKNALTARDATRQAEFSARWLALPEDLKSKIKQETLMTLASPTPRIGSYAATVVASVAAIELPENHWSDLIQILLGFINNRESVGLRISTLTAIGYICESIKPEILASRSNEILTAVVQGARKEETNAEVNASAMRALYNSLEFVRENFEREGERNFLMQVVCEATQNPSVDVQVLAFECLVRIMSLYYDKMGFYMERALFGLTVLGMKNPEERVALQAVEFWSTVCEEEADIAVEAADALEYGEVPERESKDFARIALPEILPVILTLLTRQEEDADEDEWNISMAAGTCLVLLATAVNDAIVPAVIPFIESNITSQDWHQREAAVMAFGSILDGPDPQVLAPLIHQALPVLLQMLNPQQEKNEAVKDTTAWTLARICDLHSTSLNTDNELHTIVAAVVTGLEDKPRISANCAWALQTLVDNLSGYNYEEDVISPTGPISRYYEGVITALMRVTEKPTNESNHRTATYETMGAFVTHSAQDTLPIVSQVILAILTRQEQLLAMQNQILGVDDRTNWNELQSNFCSILMAAIRKLGAEINPLVDRIMTNTLQLVRSAGKQSTVLEDAFLVVGTMASALEANFQSYLPPFLPFLYPALRATEDQHLCIIAIGIIGDVCRALGENSAQYCNAFMNVLLENLQLTTVGRDVKLAVLGCFGDVALAIGGSYEPYLETTMLVLKQAGEFNANPLDYDSIDHVAQLRETIIEAEVGIVSGLKGSNKAQLILPYVPAIIDLLKRACQDEERSDTVYTKAMGLIGDLAEAFPNGEIRDQLLAEWIINNLVKSKPRGLTPEGKRTIKWAKEMVRKATTAAPGFA
ncbi:karyopherin Kap95 [Cantharellus anzutake]|uniref:karyopherin Kap95 n=1 Tax=Cantharellus anzutake TaxID=1750568 RepID=UPI001907CEE3|nr:karyopherin Kap95 [Cantharellus anzutake]KAF8335779.1 karyopherin Kap95 [Cantharellus anzutake]